MKSTTNRNTIAFLILTVCFGIYYGLFSFFTPFMGDCVLFVRDYRVINGGDESLSISGLWNFMAEMRAMDNCRLDNLIYMAVQLTQSHTAAAVAAGISAMLLSLGAWLLMGKRLGALMPFLATVMLLMPWREATMALCNYMNTMLPAAVTLLFLHIFLSCGAMSRRRMAAAAVFALIAGAIHEGYSCSILAGIAVMAAMRRFRLPRQQWILGGVYALGALFLITAPGMLMRVAARGEVSVTIKGTLTMMMPVAAFIAVIAAAICFRSGRSRLAAVFGSNPGIILTTGLIASGWIALAHGIENPRALWIPCLYAAVLMAELAAPLASRVPMAATAAALGAAGAFGVQQIAIQRSISIREDFIAAEMARSAHGTVFMDYDIDLPRTAMLQPLKNVWLDDLHLWSVNIDRRRGEIFSVVPDTLRHLTAAQTAAINSGRNPGPGFTPVAGKEKEGWWYFGHTILAPDAPIIRPLLNGKPASHTALFTTLSVGIPGEGERTLPFMIQKFVAPCGDSLCIVRTAARGIEPPFESVR